MKLYSSPTSPYGRKVLVVAHEKRLIDRIAVVQLDPWANPPELLAVTPLGKVPALITDDGASINDSTVIAEYFDQIEPDPKLIDTNRLGVLARAALAQGLIDAAFAAVLERRRPAERQWDAWFARQRQAIERTLADVARPDQFDLGGITLACGLAYLDFRLPEIDWRAARPELAAWLDRVARRPSMQATNP